MDYQERIRQKKEEFDGLFKRMDADRLLKYLDPYIMRDLDGREVPGIINVTLNDPAVFAAYVESSLASTAQQVVVETEDRNLDASYIEEFQGAVLNAADESLQMAGRWPLDSFINEQVCLRGRAIGRCVVQEVEGVLNVDIMPWDARYVYYERDRAGVIWAAYETIRRRVAAEEYYGLEPRGKGDELVEVLDVWDREHNEIWIGGENRWEQTHKYGETPVIIETVTLGSMLADDRALEHTGESIFFLIRDLVPEFNRLVSIMQTVNMHAAKGAYQYASDQGPIAELPEGYDSPGSTTGVEKGGGLALVPIADIQRAAVQLHSILETRLQRGSLSSTDLGNLSFPLSAVALVQIGEGRDQVFLPRIQAKARFNQALAGMFTRQVLAIKGGQVKIGPKGHERVFSTGKLKGEYRTTYRYFPKQPEIDAGRYSMAKGASEWLDSDTIREDILRVRNPDEVRRKRYLDMAEEMSPLVRMDRVVRALIEEERDWEARLMAKEVGATLGQVLSGRMGSPKRIERSEQETLPMLPEGRSESGKRAAELRGMPRQEAEGG